MAKTSLYNGYIRGKARAIKLGPNNPAIVIAGNLSQLEAEAKTRAHVTKGTMPAVKLDGPARRASGVKGRRVSGGMRIRGGAV